MNIYRLFQLPISKIQDYINFDEGTSKIVLQKDRLVRKKITKERIYLIEVTNPNLDILQTYPIVKFWSELGYILTLNVTESRKVYSVSFLSISFDPSDDESVEPDTIYKTFSVVEGTLTPDMTLEEILRRSRK